MDSLTLDALDRRIVHALSIDGRASLSRISAALACSDRTVAHRYRRLRESGVRVVGLVDRRRMGGVDWLVRLHCAPDAAETLAVALARREDTTWVAVASGGTEITCIAQTADERGALLLEKLSRTPRINTVTAHCLLRDVAGTMGWHARTSSLDQSEIDSIRSQVPEQADIPVQLSSTDWSLLRALTTDGRTSYPTLAKMTGWSQSTVRRRLPELRQRGVLYFDVDIAPLLLGYRCEALLWLTVAPAQLTPVTRALAQHQEVAYAAATTGSTNIAAFLVCRDHDSFYDYLATRIGALDGVLQVETSPITQQVKRAGATIQSSRP